MSGCFETKKRREFVCDGMIRDGRKNWISSYTSVQESGRRKFGIYNNFIAHIFYELQYEFHW